MKDGEKIENTFEWFVLTVEAGLAGSFPKDMGKRIEHCKKQIEAHKTNQTPKTSKELNNGYGNGE